MNNLKSFIEEFDKTGVLVDDEDIVLEILNTYKRLVNDLLKVPDMGCAFTHAVLMKNRIRCIADARGYKP